MTSDNSDILLYSSILVIHGAEKEDICDPFCYTSSAAIKNQGNPSVSL